MDSKRSVGSTGGSANGAEIVAAPAPRSNPLASRGIRTTTDVKRVCFALAEDVLNGAVAPKVSSAAIGAIRAGMSTFQLEMRYAENQPCPTGGIDLIDSPVPDQVTEKRQKLLAELAALDSASGEVVNETQGGARKT